jgi:superfamily II DNA or RNA helicase
MRLSTHGKPRVIACGELFADHLALPRGCLEEARALLGRYGVRVRVRDERTYGATLDVGFTGQLTADQEAAVAALRRFDTGVLAATTAFGKTVVAARLIAERKTNTLVLVHRRHLLQQWVERLGSFLGLGPEAIGIIGAGKRRPTGRLDVAVIQSLNRKGAVDDLVADYGQIVVDECHHVSAVRFEAVAQAAKARYVLGLSATVTRKDGHHPIVLMQCGPVRHRVDARRQARGRPFGHRVVSRQTDFVYPRGDATEPRITDLYAAIAADAARNALIVGDVREAVRAGRVPVVMTERREHADRLAALLAPHVPCVVRLRAGLPAAEVRAARHALADEDAVVGRVLVATGRYLGEGFDNARLDTLFLAMPISWRGTLAQYAGRLHRLHAAKREVVIYDYVDASEPVFARMAERRYAGYRGLGYTIASGTPLGL